MLSGGAGDDVLEGGAGDDTLTGGDGSDTARYDTGIGGVTVNLTLTGPQAVGGDQGTDTLTSIENVVGTGYDDLLTGTSGNNTLTSGDGNDVLRPGDGNDKVYGGDGDDTISFTGGRLTRVDTIDGGAGSDTVWLNGDYTGANAVYLDTFTSFTNIESIAMADGFSYNITLSYVEQSLTVDGSRLGATHTLTLNNPLGSTGNFLVIGGAGADSIYGGGANDTLSGRAGNDTLRPGGGDDHAYGGDGDDTISFTGGRLNAAAMVDGGAGTDTLWLNGDYTGANAVVFSAATMQNVESIGLAGFGFSYNLTLADANVGAGSLLTVDGYYLGASDTLTFNGSAETDGSFAVTGGLGADAIVTGNGADTIYARAGNDTLRPGWGADSVYGGDGDDTISFSGGKLSAADIIDGGAGTDMVWLNGDYSGANAVVFNATTITNVESIGVARGFNYSLTSNNATVGAGKTLIVDASNLGASNTLTFNGAAETNGLFLLISGSGGDNLTGGTGADVFRYDGAARSTGLAYDTINALNFANDSFDIPGGVGVVTGIDPVKTTGTLSTASFDSDLTSRMFYLGAHHAILFTPNAGTLSGQTFMVVDCNGTAGYQSGQDLVIRLNGYSGTLSAGAFH